MATAVTGPFGASDGRLQTRFTKDSNCPFEEGADDFMDCSTEDESLPCELLLDDAHDGAIASTSGGNDQSSTMTRSVSQENAHMHVQRVLQRIEQYERAVLELKDEVAGLNSALVKDSNGQSEQQVTLVLKRARNLGEDLVEDLLGLDQLTGLLPADRAGRKDAVKKINSLLDEIDACKTIVVKVQTAIRNASEAQRGEDQANAETKKCEKERGTTQTFEPLAVSASASPLDLQAIAPPRVETWTDMQASVDFQTRQQRGGYMVLGAIPSLRRDSLEIKRDERTRELTVSGVCLPTLSQAEQMHQHVVGKIGRLVSAHPHQLSKIAAQGNDVALQLYRELGEGKFGRFSETFRMPMDVDTARISAQFNDGVLSISLPQSLHRNYNVMTDPSYGRQHRYPHNARSGLSKFHW